MPTQSTWKQIYPWVKTTVTHLESVDLLLAQTVKSLAALYQADCLLWAGLEFSEANLFQVYSTAGVRHQVAGHSVKQQSTSSQLDLPLEDSTTLWRLYPDTLPQWLVEQQQAPQVTQLSTGELIIPVTSDGKSGVEAIAPSSTSARSLQLVLLLNRPLLIQETLPQKNLAQTDQAVVEPQLVADTAPIQSWSLAEIESVEIVCSQLSLAYSALYWRQRLEQSRQQTFLVGRIGRLLNSNLNPDEIVGRIVAELGQGLECDRCILVDLRNTPSSILAVWEHPDQDLPPLDQHSVNQTWQNVAEMFCQEGASYLEVEQSESESAPMQNWLQAVGAVSSLIVPLFIQAEFFGAVSLLSYQRGKNYQLDELQTIRQVADQAAIALANAQHYQSLWHKQEALRMQNNSVQLEIVRDELTQLMNRRSLERELEQLSTKAVWAVQETFCVIVLDIDYFKLVNDTHGHLVGDEILQHLAQRLQRQLRKETAAYRYGGEEFAVILTETTLTKAVDVAERLRQAIRAEPMKTTVGAVDITASFGIAQQRSTQDHSAWDVLQRANRALYDAKREGRDRVKAL
jgi:diguanylate cyclase (GGDEF)-like protein